MRIPSSDSEKLNPCAYELTNRIFSFSCFTLFSLWTVKFIWVVFWFYIYVVVHQHIFFASNLSLILMFIISLIKILGLIQLKWICT